MKAAKIDTVEGLKQQVAEAYAEGATQEEIAALAGVSDRGTVAEWLKREDVQLLVSKCIQDRSNRILRHTDTKIEKKLQADSDDKMSLEKLLKVRQTYAGREIKMDLTGDKSQVLEDFLKELDENPELAGYIERLEADSDDDEEAADDDEEGSPGLADLPPEELVAEVERDLILETLKHCLGNRTHASNILGISIRTLRNKLNEYAADGSPIPPPHGGSELKGAA